MSTQMHLADGELCGRRGGREGMKRVGGREGGREGEREHLRCSHHPHDLGCNEPILPLPHDGNSLPSHLAVR